MSELNNRDRALDGLRGIAALGVVVSHFVMLYFPTVLLGYYGGTATPSDWAVAPLGTVFFCGGFQVMVFFVLSGYVLTLPFWLGNREVLVERLLGRFLRLNIPIAAVTVISFALCFFGFMYNHALAGLLHNDWFDSFFKINTHILYNAIRAALYHSIIFGSRAFDPPLWSIHYEFVGSVVLLGLYFVAGRLHRWIIPISLAVLFLVAPDDRAYYGCFVFGAALGGIDPARLRRWTWVFLLLGLLLGSAIPGTLLYTWLPLCEAFGGQQFYRMIGAIFVVCAVRSGLGSAFLQSRIVQYLGSISYSMYVLHFLVLASAVSFWHLALPVFPGKLAVLALLYLLFTLLASHLFRRFVDTPSITVARTFSRHCLRIVQRDRPVPANRGEGKSMAMENKP